MINATQDNMELGDHGLTADGVFELGDAPMRLFDLVQELRDKDLLIPEHQREAVWTKDQIAMWVERITDPMKKPIGVISTYQILKNGKASPKYLNDGRQRLYATESFLMKPEDFGHTRDAAIKISKAYKIPVQHRLYDSHASAMKDFQLMNLGTALSPHEFHKGLLKYHDHSTFWDAQINVFARSITDASVRLGIKQQTGTKAHKYARHNLALLLRWLDKDNRLGYEGISDNIVKPSRLVQKTTPASHKHKNTNRQSPIEELLRSTLEKISISDLESEVELLCGFINNRTALIETVMHEKFPRQKAPHPVLYSYLIETAMWAKFSKKPASDWEVFCSKLIEHSGGVGVVGDKDDARKRVTLAIGTISNLKAVCERIESDFYEGQRPSRKRAENVRPGYDISHKLPFVHHGDGETFFEPALRNRARGARPIEDDAE